MGILHSDLEFNLCPLNPQAIIKPRDTVERAVGIASSSDTLMANSRDNLFSHSGHGPHILPLCGLLIDVTSVWAMYLPEFISGKRVRIGVRVGEKTQSTQSPRRLSIVVGLGSSDTHMRQDGRTKDEGHGTQPQWGLW